MSSAARDLVLPPDLKRLKSATRRAVKALGGTSLAAEELHIRQQRVSDCQLVNTNDFLRLDEVLALDEATRGTAGWPIVATALARTHGFALMPLPTALDASPSWHQSIAAVARGASEVTAGIAEALADDGQVSPREICEGRMIDRIEDAIGMLMVLRGRCTAVAGEGGEG